MHKSRLVWFDSFQASVVAAVSAAKACENADGTPAATVGTDGALRRPDIAGRCLHLDERRSVSEEALLQDQFSEGKCAGRPSIE